MLSGCTLTSTPPRSMSPRMRCSCCGSSNPIGRESSPKIVMFLLLFLSTGQTGGLPGGIATHQYIGDHKAVYLLNMILFVGPMSNLADVRDTLVRCQRYDWIAASLIHCDSPIGRAI